MTLLTAILTAVVASVSAIIGLCLGAIFASSSDADRRTADLRRIEQLEAELEQARNNAAHINDTLDRYDRPRNGTRYLNDDDR